MNDFARIVCEELGGVDPPDKTPAKLFQGDRLLSTGVATVEISRRFGTFWPSDETQLDIQDRGVKLKLKGIVAAIPIADLYWCGPPHYHFHLA